MAAIVVAFAFAVAVSCLSLREMGERQELESTSRADLYRGVVHEVRAQSSVDYCNVVANSLDHKQRWLRMRGPI